MDAAGCQPDGPAKVDKWLARVWRALCPPACVLCGAEAERIDLCAGCEADLPRSEPVCARCAAPVAGIAAAMECGRCLRRPPPFDRAICAFDYAFPVDRLLQALKFRGALVYGRVLGELLAARIAAVKVSLPAVIVPMPLHRSRQGERGFNQACEIARPVARRLGLPVDAGGVIRARATAEQTHLNARERRANLRDAFAARRVDWPGRVAIIDDVLTTGSTAGELARTLKKVGVRRVDVWCVARTSHERT